MSEQSDDDRRWYQVLTGRADPKQDPEAAALRESILADEVHAEEDSVVDQLALRRLMGRLEKEELLQAPQRAPNRQRWYALAASVALLAVAIPAIMQLSPDGPDGTDSGEIWRGLVEPQEIGVADPGMVSARIESELAAAGVTVQRYEYEGQWIIDAEVAGPQREVAREILSTVGAALTEDGRVVLAFSQQLR